MAKEVDQELGYLLSLADPKTTSRFELGKIECLLDFVQKNSAAPDYRPAEIDGTVSAYYAFSVNTSLSNLLRYCYSPELNSAILMPSVVRSFSWEEINGIKQGAAPDLFEELSTLTAPFSFCGVGRQNLTPDINTGAYFSYSENQCMILIPGALKTFITIGVQRDKSEVGKKGAVIGDDDQWIYLYSGEQGVTARGIGWAKTYIYAASSVTVYSETESNTLNVSAFKWLDAGWSGFNMSKTKHLINGMQRFADTLKYVMESPRLPAYEILLGEQQKVAAIPPEELREQVAPYFAMVAAMDDPLVKREPFSTQLTSGNYLQSLSPSDMEKILLTEYLKGQLGGQPLIAAPQAMSPTDHSVN
ncbi:MAG: hypothetical protein PHP44_09810 [Kiritimatiellae bacterium]|nr:hypothetical protein [Kiritimatiellia bacterium]